LTTERAELVETATADRVEAAVRTRRRAPRVN
jgi:hypothetical protein